MKTKKYVKNYARYTTLKTHFLCFLLGRMTLLQECQNLNHDTVEIFNYKK